MSGAANALEFFGDNSNAASQVRTLTLFGDGKVGIKTETPTEALEVTGNVKARGFTFGQDTLEDYDHGSWTPTYPNSGGFDGNGTNCRYVRVGRVVNIWANFKVSSTGTGDFAFAGLPYAPAVAATIGSAMLSGPTLPSGRGGQSFYTDTSEVRIYSNVNNASWTNMQWSAFSVDDYIYFQGSYYTEA